jgi:hypothetical protein
MYSPQMKPYYEYYILSTNAAIQLTSNKGLSEESEGKNSDANAQQQWREVKFKLILE